MYYYGKEYRSNHNILGLWNSFDFADNNGSGRDGNQLSRLTRAFHKSPSRCRAFDLFALRDRVAISS
jgi:hypothetical protein